MLGAKLYSRHVGCMTHSILTKFYEVGSFTDSRPGKRQRRDFKTRWSGFRKQILNHFARKLPYLRDKVCLPVLYESAMHLGILVWTLRQEFF